MCWGGGCGFDQPYHTDDQSFFRFSGDHPNQTADWLCVQVEGVVVINNEGIPIKSTLDSTSTVQVSFLFYM
jgi:hypothetical protein